MKPYQDSFPIPSIPVSSSNECIFGLDLLGFFDTAEEGDWRWVDCSVPQGVVEWDVGQPDDINATQNCGELTENSKINDLECGALRMYVCEITRKGKPGKSLKRTA